MIIHYHHHDLLKRNHDLGNDSDLAYLTSLYAMLSKRYVMHFNPCNIAYYMKSHLFFCIRT